MAHETVMNVGMSTMHNPRHGQLGMSELRRCDGTPLLGIAALMCSK
jgi:hypothetical protein